VLITATVPAALELVITALDGRETGAVCVALASNRDAVPCPLCGTLARRRHSR
jgi:hypothetical protein